MRGGDRREVKRRKKMEDSTGVKSLPSEIIGDILSRLAVKSLLRLRCVCKLWRSIISDPLFIDLHLQRAKRNPQLIIFSREGHHYRSLNIHIADRNGLPIHKWTNVVGGSLYRVSPSCNGLVCLFSRNRIYVCNPSTHQIILLPQSTSASQTLFHCGFGFDPSTKNYKVIKLTTLPPGSNSGLGVNLNCEIFTLGSNSWRLIGTPPYQLDDQRPVFVNGKLHWITSISQMSYNHIVSFDVGNETFGVVPHPDCFTRKQWAMLRIMELGGCLCLHDRDLKDRRLMDLWILKDYANHGWIKQSIVFPFMELPFPVAIQNEEILVCMCTGMGVGKLRFYNLHSKSWVETIELLQVWACVSIRSYVDSVVPLGMDPNAHEDDNKNDAEDADED